jgi:hypothetical protein
MRRPLDPDEESVLRRLGQQLSREDPALARELRRPGEPALVRWSPLRWPAAAYMAIGVVLLVLGGFLEVGSAVWSGLLALGVGAGRSPVLRRRLRRMLSAQPGNWFPR